jgi:hypothetical protein
MIKMFPSLDMVLLDNGKVTGFFCLTLSMNTSM